jgi:hypothetical protein
MDFAPAPVTAAWRHRGARTGFEVAYSQVLDRGWRVQGRTTAIEDGVTWAAEYLIGLDGTGAARSARIRGRPAAGFSPALLGASGAGRRLAGGVPAAHLDGCLDMDLESPAVTSAPYAGAPSQGLAG